ncbi:tryptophan-rich sensory protein [Flavobacteriales bacterium]|nr:tryptophan-rich sensory protein [Flavobacteriales bacterium]
MNYRIIIFLLINFLALAIGSFFTSKGVPSIWYEELSKAPWTPPGWFFGFAWTSIMICFSIYMAYLWPTSKNKSLLVTLFLIQWILNTGWNPVFFQFHNVAASLVIISALTILIGYFFYANWTQLKLKSLLIAPYFIWLIIATSLNAFVLIKN